MMEEYRKLKEAESRLDDITQKKVLVIEEEHNARLKCLKTLRIFLTQSICENSYNLRLDGRVINDLRNNIEMKTSQLLKRVTVVLNEDYNENSDTESLKNENNIDSLDKALSEDPSLININNEEKKNFSNGKKIELNEIGADKEIKIFEWHSDENILEKDFDSFELRHFEVPKTVKIILEFDNSKNLVKLSEPLQKILKIHTTTKTKALIEFWKYIRLNNLINKDGSLKMTDDIINVIPYDYNNIKTDAKSKIFLDKITFLMNRYGFHDPDFMAFSIPVNDYERVFDIKIERDDFTHPLKIYKNNQKNINLLESKIEHILENIKNIQDKISMLDSFIKDPVKFFEKYYFDSFNNDSAYFRDPKMQQCIFEILKQSER